MTIIVSGAALGPATFCYQNHLEDGTVTTTSQVTGFEVENCFDWNNRDYWKPVTTGTHYITCELATAQSTDYFAIYAHDYGDKSVSAQLAYSTVSSVGPWTDVGSGLAPGSTEAMLTTFDSVSARWWRIATVHGGSTPGLLGCTSFGSRLDLPIGVTPSFTPMLANGTESTIQMSESNLILGSTLLEKPVDIKATFRLIDPAWIRTYWKPFIQQRAMSKPMFFAWDTTNHSSEVAYCWMSKKPHPSYYTELFMQINIDAKGYVK